MNFQQNRVQIFLQKSRMLHKLATTNSNFEKKKYFGHASSYNVHVYQFSAELG